MGENIGLIELLKISGTYWGLKAPVFTWWAAGILLVFPLFVLVYLKIRTGREYRILNSLATSINGLKKTYSVSGRQGLSLEGYDMLEQVFRNITPSWEDLESLVVFRRSSPVHTATEEQSELGEDQCWISDTSGVVFSEDAMIDSKLNRGFYGAIPGIVTGTGLLVTFMAILVALLDVTIVNNQVKGLEDLIGGLSGKFLSSIAALLSATLYLFLEKIYFHRLTKARSRLVAAIDGFIPRLSSARLLAEVQKDISEQSVAFRHFDADLSTKLRQGFSESMGPNIDNMVKAVEELNNFLRLAEANKQDSITGSLETMLKNLQMSITTSLREMGERFKESLSGNTMGEFDNITKTLSGTAQVLENMNAQSRNMASQLTDVVHELSTKMADLGEKMAVTMNENTDKTTSAASAVVKQAGTWTDRTSDQLEQLVKQHETHLKNVKDVENALTSALELFGDSLGKYTTLNNDLRQISSEVNATVVAAGNATRNMEEIQKAVKSTVDDANSQIKHLADANQQQERVWKSIHDSMKEYTNVFDDTQNHARDLLEQITKFLTSHMELIQRGYESLVKVADEHFTNATQKLGSQVSDLGEILDVLSDNFDKKFPDSSERRK